MTADSTTALRMYDEIFPFMVKKLLEFFKGTAFDAKMLFLSMKTFAVKVMKPFAMLSFSLRKAYICINTTMEQFQPMDKSTLTPGNYGYVFISFLSMALFILCSAAIILFDSLSLREPALLLKTLLVPMLMVNTLCLIFRDRGDRTAAVAVAGAMVFHAVGDGLMEFGGNTFLLALGAFLVGHVILLLYFIRGVGKQHFPGNLVWMIAAVIAVLAGLWLPPSSEMILPVCVYSLALLYYPASALAGMYECRRSRKMGEEVHPLRDKAFLRILCGGILFILSDGLIALYVFKGMEIPLYAAVVMVLYLGAEFLLSRGAWLLSRCPAVPAEDFDEKKEDENFAE